MSKTQITVTTDTPLNQLSPTQLVRLNLGGEPAAIHDVPAWVARGIVDLMNCAPSPVLFKQLTHAATTGEGNAEGAFAEPASYLVAFANSCSRQRWGDTVWRLSDSDAQLLIAGLSQLANDVRRAGGADQTAQVQQVGALISTVALCPPREEASRMTAGATCHELVLYGLTVLATGLYREAARVGVKTHHNIDPVELLTAASAQIVQSIKSVSPIQ